jgi:hypothetical protein
VAASIVSKLDHEVVSRERYILRQRAVHKPRSTDDELAGPVELEVVPLPGSFDDFQDQSHGNHAVAR